MITLAIAQASLAAEKASLREMALIDAYKHGVKRSLAHMADKTGPGSAAYTPDEVKYFAHQGGEMLVKTWQARDAERSRKAKPRYEANRANRIARDKAKGGK